MARWLGLTQGGVSSHVNQNGAPANPDGSLSMATYLPWLYNFLKKGGIGSDETLDLKDELLKITIKKKKTEDELLTFKRDLEAGRLLTLDEYTNREGTICRVFVQTIETAGELAPRLTMKAISEVQRIINAWIVDSRNELAERSYPFRKLTEPKPKTKRGRPRKN